MTPDQPLGAEKVPTDPSTGREFLLDDLRDRFAELTAQAPQDSSALGAFLQSKIEMIERDSRLSKKQKRDALASLKQQLDEEMGA